MPPKLQVDESFAFLFMCIEASGCKIDFKLVGDATDLMPAAARMRYSRLRKAVQSGHFKGAVLSQPAPTSPQLAALANPESRRLGRLASQLSRVYQHRRKNKGSSLQSSATVDDEEEEEEEGVDSGDGLMLPPNSSGTKRRASTVFDDEDGPDMFYPDTSRASRQSKHIKRSDSDVEAEAEEAEEMEEAEEAEEAEEVKDMEEDDDDDVDYTPNTKPITLPQSRPRAIPSAASKAQRGSRQAASRANGQASSRYAPSPEEMLGGPAQQTGRGGQLSTTNNSNRNGMRRLTDRDRQFFERRASQSPQMGSTSLPADNPFTNFRPAGNYGPHNGVTQNSSYGPVAGQAANMPDHTADTNAYRPYQPQSPNPDMASVFDGFEPPYSYHSRVANANQNASRSNLAQIFTSQQTKKNNSTRNANANIDPALRSRTTASRPAATPSTSSRPMQVRPTQAGYPPQPQETQQHPIQPVTQSQHESGSETFAQPKTRTSLDPASELTNSYTAQPQSDTTSKVDSSASTTALISHREGTTNTTADEMEVAEMLKALREGSSAPATPRVAQSPVPISSSPTDDGGDQGAERKQHEAEPHHEPTTPAAARDGEMTTSPYPDLP